MKLSLIKPLLLYALLHLFFSSAFAQEYNFKRFSIEEGLPRSGVYDICEDRQGYLWIGTEEGGVSVFDGTSFHTFTTEDGLVSNTVRCIYEDSKGVLWFGTNKGLSSFDGERFITYTIEGNNLPEIRSIQADKEGVLHLGTLGQGVLKVVGIKSSALTVQRFTTRNGLLHNKVRVLLLDSKGVLWVGTDGGLTQLKGDMLTKFTTNEGLPHNKVLSIFEDKSKTLWFGTQNGLSHYVAGEFTNYTTKDGLISNRIKAISQDYMGYMWFGTKKGAVFFDGKFFNHVTEKNGLSNNRIRVIKHDRANNLWLGTYFGGVNQYRGETFVKYTTKDGLLNNQIYAIAGERNEMFFGTFEGANIFKIYKNELYPKDYEALEGIQDRVNLLYYSSRSKIWIGTESGLFYFNDINKTVVESPIHDEIHALLEQDSLVLVGTSNGLFQIVDDEVCQLVEGCKVTSIVKWQDNKWVIGTEQKGLVVLDNNFKEIEKVLTKFTFNAIVTDKKGRLWCATSNSGLVRLDKDNSYQIFNHKEGLISSNHAHLLIFDSHDDLWVGYENGVDLLHLNRKGEIEEVHHFGNKEGFSGIETNKNAVYKDEKGRIWFGTIRGAICFNPDAEKINSKPPSTHIINVNTHGNGLEKKYSKFRYYEASSQSIIDQLKIPFQQNNISFLVKGVNLSFPQKVKYSTKLEGYDKVWSKPSDIEVYSYTNLPYGKYKFLVKSCNENYIWNEQPTVYEFEITAPFWKRIWFYVLVGVLLLLMFYVVFQWRLRQLKIAKDNLQKEVDVRTKELVSEKEKVEKKNIEIENKRVELQDKNKSITDSINYAKRIQQAVMSPKRTAGFSFRKNMFILNKPRDIVSGDFYWFTEKDNKIFVVASDCTGHGVPGAFMSMLGITFLNQIINEENNTDSAQILNSLRLKIVEALENEDDTKQSPDGMDLAMLIFDYEKMEVQYSGANNPLLYIKNNEIKRLRADKMPVGSSDYMSKSFTSHRLSFEKGDVFYIYSDGYVDQFGGPKGKKFMSKRFRELLLKISHLPLPEQNETLDQTIEDWRGEEFQVDDILVIGIRA